jgi:hypothetical protein
MKRYDFILDVQVSPLLPKCRTFSIENLEIGPFIGGALHEEKSISLGHCFVCIFLLRLTRLNQNVFFRRPRKRLKWLSPHAKIVHGRYLDKEMFDP